MSQPSQTERLTRPRPRPEFGPGWGADDEAARLTVYNRRPVGAPCPNSLLTAYAHWRGLLSAEDEEPLETVTEPPAKSILFDPRPGSLPRAFALILAVALTASAFFCAGAVLTHVLGTPPPPLPAEVDRPDFARQMLR